MSGTPLPEARFIRFGEFEVDLSAWVLREKNQRISLQRKPFQILRLLLSRPGEVVSRAELARELWPDLHVSYEGCLNTAVNALRNALDDPTRQSRFIETRAGLGYCFVGRISGVAKQEEPVVPREGEPNLTMGYYLLHRFAFETVARARACFTAALQSDKLAAAGHAALAGLENLSAVCGQTPTREACERALLHARAAQSRDPADTESQIALAVASALHGGVYEEAIRTCHSALEQTKQSVTAHLWLGELLCACGRASDAVEHLQSAMQLNPTSSLIRSRLSLAAYLAGHYEAAVEQAWAALTMESACARSQHTLALAYQQSGYLDDAITEFENASQCAGGSYPEALAGLCHALQKAGRHTEAEKVAMQLDEIANSIYVSSCWKALVQISFDDRAASGQSLLRAAETGDCLRGIVTQDPRFR